MSLQCEELSLGSPFGVTFANFYAAYVGNNIIENYSLTKPVLLNSNVDVCFIIAKDITVFEN